MQKRKRLKETGFSRTAKLMPERLETLLHGAPLPDLQRQGLKKTTEPEAVEEVRSHIEKGFHLLGVSDAK